MTTSKFGRVLDIEREPEVAARLQEEGYRLTQEALDRIGSPHASDPSGMCIEGHCYHASDVVTRMAQNMGFTATREEHDGDHFITSLAPPELRPSDDDTIVCLTWGQYVRYKYGQLEVIEFINEFGDANRPGYIGPRKGIVELVGERNFRDNYSVESIWSRSIAYSKNPLFGHPDHTRASRYMWLRRRAQDGFGLHDSRGLTKRESRRAYLWAPVS